MYVYCYVNNKKKNVYNCIAPICNIYWYYSIFHHIKNKIAAQVDRISYLIFHKCLQCIAFTH